MKKVKIFLPNQKYFATFGICRHQANQSQSFNVKNLLPSIIFGLAVICCSGFPIYEANNFNEYTQSIYITSATIAATIIFILFISNVKDYFNFIDGWEECVQQSKYDRASRFQNTEI